MRSSRPILIVNTRSRHGARRFQLARNALARKGLQLEAARLVSDPATLAQALAEAVGQGSTFVILGGGDGTVSAGASALAYSDAKLGILPLGTANDFARTLDIPLDLDGAAEVLRDGRVDTVDLGMVNDRYFASGVSIGLPAAVGRAAPSDVKRRLGRAGYLHVACRQFLRYKPFRCMIDTSSQRTGVETLGVRIANGRYVGACASPMRRACKAARSRSGF
jgi:YegS/Rv2252/BmrU family lipid kinase